MQEASTAPTRGPGALARAAEWLAVAMVLLTFACVIGGTLAAWWRVAPRPPTELERYFPHASGTTLSYSVSGEQAPRRYQSSSAELLEGNEAGAQLTARLLTRALSLSAGGAPTDDDDAMIARAQLAEVHALRVARIGDTLFEASGAFTPTVGLYLLLPRRVGLIAIDGQALDPPLPILDLDLAVGAATEATGSFDDALPYTATLTLEAREALDTPAGRLADCLRTRLELRIGEADALLVSWFCDGVGLARQESRPLGATAVDTYELIGANTPGLLARGELPPPASPDLVAQSRGPDGYGALPELPAGELAPLWHYREPGSNVDVTGAPLAVGELLVFGTANGGLVAVDRATHAARWRFQAGGAIVGAPVAAGGVLYVGANDRKLYALDLVSGAFRWAFAARDAISASPAVAGDTVYVGSEDRSLYALAAADGSERWRFTAGDAIVTTPRLAGGALFFGADDGVLYALDAATGAPRWAFSADDAITAAPLVRDGVVYVGAHDGTLYALRADSAEREGELLWAYDADEAIANSLALAGDSIYLATVDGSLRAVDLQRGAERWRAGDGIAFDGAPLVAGERVLIGRNSAILVFSVADGSALEPIQLGEAITSYGLTASVSGAGGELFAGRASGVVQVIGSPAGQPWATRPLWTADELSAHLRRQAEHTLVAPALGGERLVGVTYSGLVYSVSATDGGYRDHGRLGGDGPFLVPPAADGRALYAIDAGGTLLAFDLQQGRVRWRAPLGGITRSAPVLADGRVLVAVTDSVRTVAYAFDLASGEQVWRTRLAPSPTGAAYTLLHSGRFFVTAGALAALDPASGATVWSSAGPLIAVQLAAAGDTLYSFAYDGEGWVLAAWDAVSGEQRLSAPLDAPTFPNLAGGIAAGDGMIALLLNDRTLLALDAASGDERWRLRLGGGLRGPPVIHGGVVLVQTQRNHLLAYSLADGRLRGDFALIDDSSVSDTSAVAPLVSDGRLYVAFYQSLAALQLMAGER